MSTLCLTLALAVAMTAGWASSQDISWTNATNMPWAVGESSAGILQNARGEPLLVVMGFDLPVRNRTAVDVTMVMDVLRGNWSRKADRPFKGHHMAAATVGNKLYLIGGILNNSSFNLQIYDPITNTWQVGPPPPFASGAGCATALNDTIYYCGGILNGLTFPLKSCALFNVTSGAWSNVNPMPQAVHHCSMGNDGSRIYVIGGRNSNGNNGLRPVNFNQIYDPVKKTWIISGKSGGPAPLPVGRGGMGPAVYMGGKLYITGGECECNNKTAPYICPSPAIGFSAVGVFNRVDRYDPVANTWDLGLGYMAAPRHGQYPVLGPDPTGSKQVAWVCGGGLVTAYHATNVCQYMDLVY